MQLRWPIVAIVTVFLAVAAWELCFTTLQPEATLSVWETKVIPTVAPSGWETKVAPKIWGGPGWQWC